MIKHSIDIRNWIRIMDVGGPLSPACSQAITTGSLRPNVDTGESGAGPESEHVYYELEYEQGRPVVIEQTDADSAEQVAAFEAE